MRLVTSPRGTVLVWTAMCSTDGWRQCQGQSDTRENSHLQSKGNKGMIDMYLEEESQKSGEQLDLVKINALVKMATKYDKGVAEHGGGLHTKPDNTRMWLENLQEELMDGVFYIEKMLYGPMSKFNFSKRSLRNMDGVHPDLQQVLHTALGLGVIDFVVIQGVRTQAEQDRLYAQGRTEPGPVVTWTRNSKHLVQDDGWGHAVDVVPYPTFFDDREAFYTLGGVIQSAASLEGKSLRWGESFRNTDLPHWEVRD